jgi:hypothetical protein
VGKYWAKKLIHWLLRTAVYGADHSEITAFNDFSSQVKWARRK